MAYSNNIKRLILGLCSHGHSPEEISNLLSRYLQLRDNGSVAIQRTAEELNVPFIDADWQQLKESIPSPKTIRSWLSKNEKEIERSRESIAGAVDKGGIDTVVTGYIQEKADQQARAELQEFIAKWETELSLPLNYLDKEDLSIGTAGVPFDPHSEFTIKWETSPDGSIVRRFSVEDREEFKDIYKTMPHRGKLWKPFNECRQIGGAIIKSCSELITDIRKQSEIATGLEIMTHDKVRLEKLGLNPLFTWTIYADALGIFTEEWPEDNYRFLVTGRESCEIRWRDLQLATTTWDTKDSLVCTHRALRARYNGSEAVKEIIGLKRRLERAESRVHKELEAIQERLSVPPGGGVFWR